MGADQIWANDRVSSFERDLKFGLHIELWSKREICNCNENYLAYWLVGLLACRIVPVRLVLCHNSTKVESIYSYVLRTITPYEYVYRYLSLHLYSVLPYKWKYTTNVLQATESTPNR